MAFNRPEMHDSRRCPECKSLGKIVDRRAFTRGRNGGRTVMSRTYECYDCSKKWRFKP